MTTERPGGGFPDREHLRLALEAGRMGTWSWNAITNDVRWDDAMARRYGLTPGQFDQTFEAFIERVHPDDRDATIAAIISAQETGKDLAFEHRAVWPDGTVHWLEARGRPVTDEEGAFVGMVGVGLDTVQQMQQHLLLRHYEGFMKKGRVRFRGRQRYM